MQAGGVMPQQEWLARFMCAPHEIERAREQIILDCFHSLPYQRAGILDDLLAYSPEARVDVWVIGIRGLAVQDAAWLEEILEYRKVFRIVDLLRFLLRIEMITIAVEFIETMHRRQILVPVAEVILPIWAVI